MTFLGRGVPFTIMSLGKILRGYVVIIEVLPGDDVEEGGEEGEEDKIVSIIIIFTFVILLFLHYLLYLAVAIVIKLIQ